MRAAVGSASWRVALAGVLVTLAGFAAVLAASVQGLALVPGGSILDGYEVGLLPWMTVGTWLVPIGGLIAAIAGSLTLWTSGSSAVRAISIVPILAVLFWGLLAAIRMAPHSAVPDVAPSSSDLAAVVYSSPADTIVFLIVPAAMILVLAVTGRRRAA